MKNVLEFLRQSATHVFDYMTAQYSVLINDSGSAFGLKLIDGKPRVSATPYLYSIAENEIPNHQRFVKLGFAPSCVANSTTDIWSYSAVQPTYIYPTASMGMEVLSTDNTQDIGVIIKTGTSTSGSLTSLIDTTTDFTSGTPVAIGDIVILDKSTNPEYGYITAVSATQLTINGGFSSGGSGYNRTYVILDKSAHTGAFATKITYLDNNYVEKNEIIVLNGSTPVPTINTDIFRINSFRVVAAGAISFASGSLSIRHLSDTPVYSYITSGYTRARNAMYTVPANKTLFVTNIDFGFGTTGKTSLEYARVTTRANIDPNTTFRTDGLLNAFTDVICSNATVPIQLTMPTKVPEKTDIKISFIASDVGVCSSVLRGWVEDN